MKAKKKSAKKTATKKKLPKPIPQFSIDDLLCLFTFDEFMDALIRRVNSSAKYNKLYLAEDKRSLKDCLYSDKKHFTTAISEQKDISKMLDAMVKTLTDIKKKKAQIKREYIWTVGL